MDPAVVEAIISRRERLRNAAVEMYDALKAHDEYMLDAGYEGPQALSLHPKAALNWRRVRAAIAKAEAK